MTIRIWASANGSSNNGQTLTLDADDALRDPITSKILKSFTIADGSYSSNDGASMDFSSVSGYSWTNSGSWNDVKTVKIAGSASDLNANSLAINNIVHTHVVLRGTDDVDLDIDGAKRGTIRTDEGNDTINIGVTTNGPNGAFFDIRTRDGDDTVIFTPAVDKGWNGNDTSGVDQTINARLGEGNDLFDASALLSDSSVYGGLGGDTIIAGGGNDLLIGHAGDDSIEAGDGTDTIKGGIGNDTLYGKGGSDEIRGNAGDDKLNGGQGADTMFGGLDNDTLIGANNGDQLFGQHGDDSLSGGNGVDLLDGGKDNDTLEGGNGNDELLGKHGDDELDGGANEDLLDGGRGNDTLTGGADEDIFSFKGNFGHDVITDFELGTDLIRFENLNENKMALNYDGMDTEISFNNGARSIIVEGVDLVNPADDVVFSQGFESDTDGWLASVDGGYGSITQVASGTDGIISSEGGYHAVFEQDSTSAPFTRFDGYRDTWEGEFKASIDVYLDTNWAAGEGFDYSVAANGSDGLHQRDYIFHVTQDTSSDALLVGGSNNTNFDPRENLETVNHYEVTSSGWYTFEHHFTEAGDGSLAVDLNLYDSAGNLLFTETRNTASDIIATDIGANRYGWFTNIDIAGGIEVDNSSLSFEGSTAPSGWYEFV